jgi:hypothetical protein
MRRVFHRLEFTLGIVFRRAAAMVGDDFQTANENRDVSGRITIFRPVIAKVVDKKVTTVEHHVARVASWEQVGL